MLRELVGVALLLWTVPASPGAEAPAGSLVLLGGGERSDAVMSRVAELAGGSEARVLVVSIAHPDPDAAGAALVRELETAGVGKAEVLSFDRETAGSWENRQRVAQSSGIFFAGGDQSRLAAALRETELLEGIRELYRRGGVVAGDSAGASALGTVMITGAAGPGDPDRAVPTIRAASLALEPGLDLLPGTIVDQHFLARRRQNRLLSALLENPQLLAIGIDEATAIVVEAPSRFDVVGEGLVVVYDLAQAGPVAADGNGILAADGIVLHLLRSGRRFDLAERRPVP